MVEWMPIDTHTHTHTHIHTHIYFFTHYSHVSKRTTTYYSLLTNNILSKFESWFMGNNTPINNTHKRTMNNSSTSDNMSGMVKIIDMMGKCLEDNKKLTAENKGLTAENKGLKEKNEDMLSKMDDVWNSLPSVFIAEQEETTSRGIIAEIEKLKEENNKLKEENKRLGDTPVDKSFDVIQIKYTQMREELEQHKDELEEAHHQYELLKEKNKTLQEESLNLEKQKNTRTDIIYNLFSQLLKDDNAFDDGIDISKEYGHKYIDEWNKLHEEIFEDVVKTMNKCEEDLYTNGFHLEYNGRTHFVICVNDEEDDDDESDEETVKSCDYCDNDRDPLLSSWGNGCRQRSCATCHK